MGAGWHVTRLPPRAEWRGRQCGEICRDARQAAQHWATRPGPGHGTSTVPHCYAVLAGQPVPPHFLSSGLLSRARVWCTADQLSAGTRGAPNLPRSCRHSAVDHTGRQSAGSHQTARPGQRGLQGFSRPVPHWVES